MILCGMELKEAATTAREEGSSDGPARELSTDERNIVCDERMEHR